MGDLPLTPVLQQPSPAPQHAHPRVLSREEEIAPPKAKEQQGGGAAGAPALSSRTIFFRPTTCSGGAPTAACAALGCRSNSPGKIPNSCFGRGRSKPVLVRKDGRKRMLSGYPSYALNPPG